VPPRPKPDPLAPFHDFAQWVDRFFLAYHASNEAKTEDEYAAAEAERGRLREEFMQGAAPLTGAPGVGISDAIDRHSALAVKALREHGASLPEAEAAVRVPREFLAVAASPFHSPTPLGRYQRAAEIAATANATGPQIRREQAMKSQWERGHETLMAGRAAQQTLRRAIGVLPGPTTPVGPDKKPRSKKKRPPRKLDTKYAKAAKLWALFKEDRKSRSKKATLDYFPEWARRERGEIIPHGFAHAWRNHVRYIARRKRDSGD